MFWNGKREVTKQDIRDIYAEELTKQGAKELWTLNPTNFETREVCPDVVVVTDKPFDTERLRACYEKMQLQFLMQEQPMKMIGHFLLRQTKP